MHTTISTHSHKRFRISPRTEETKKSRLDEQILTGGGEHVNTAGVPTADVLDGQRTSTARGGTNLSRIWAASPIKAKSYWMAFCFSMEMLLNTARTEQKAKVRKGKGGDCFLFIIRSVSSNEGRAQWVLSTQEHLSLLMLPTLASVLARNRLREIWPGTKDTTRQLEVMMAKFRCLPAKKFPSAGAAWWCPNNCVENALGRPSSAPGTHLGPWRAQIGQRFPEIFTNHKYQTPKCNGLLLHDTNSLLLYILFFFDWYTIFC